MEAQKEITEIHINKSIFSNNSVTTVQQQLHTTCLLLYFLSGCVGNVKVTENYV